MILIEIIRGFFIFLFNKSINIEKPFRMRQGVLINTNKGNITIGRNFRAFPNVHLNATKGGNLVIQDHVFFNRNCIVVARGNISIGANTRFGPNVCVYDHDHCFDPKGVYGTLKIGKVIIEDNCWIGAGSIILRDTEIGEGSVIGAGTIVKGKIPAHSLVTNDRKMKIRKIEDK